MTSINKTKEEFENEIQEWFDNANNIKHYANYTGQKVHWIEIEDQFKNGLWSWIESKLSSTQREARLEMIEIIEGMKDDITEFELKSGYYLSALNDVLTKIKNK